MQTEKFNATPEMISEWKKKNKVVKQITLTGVEEFEGESFTAIVRIPTLDDISSANVIGGKDAIKSASIIAKKIWLGGDEVILTNTPLFMGYMAKCQELVTVCEGEIKNL